MRELSAKNKTSLEWKKKSLPQKIMQLLRKRASRPGGTTVAQIAKALKTPREKTAKTIFLLFAKKKLEIYAEFVELKKKPHKK